MFVTLNVDLASSGGSHTKLTAADLQCFSLEQLIQLLYTCAGLIHCMYISMLQRVHRKKGLQRRNGSKTLCATESLKKLCGGNIIVKSCVITKLLETFHGHKVCFI